MARLATRKLIALINNDLESIRSLDTMVSPQFVPGNSTGAAPAA